MCCPLLSSSLFSHLHLQHHQSTTEESLPSSLLLVALLVISFSFSHFPSGIRHSMWERTSLIHGHSLLRNHCLCQNNRVSPKKFPLSPSQREHEKQKQPQYNTASELLVLHECKRMKKGIRDIKVVNLCQERKTERRALSLATKVTIFVVKQKQSQRRYQSHSLWASSFTVKYMQSK